MSFLSRFVNRQATAATPPAAQLPSDQPRYRPGDLIGGNFLVHHVLGGGMGEVYLCLDLEQNYPFALKTLRQQFFGDPQMYENFRHEVATWIALESHPNIVRCFYMATLDNLPFMVMEWVAGAEGMGTDLQNWLRYGPLDLRLALEFMIDICNGLIHAGQQQPGIVHRDLKPANVLIAQDRVAKITDFGLAAIIQKSVLARATRATVMSVGQSILGANGAVGTPQYMAPEQWHAARVDVRTDIYALGCMLYELLSGQPPYLVDVRGKSLDEIYAGLQQMHERATVPQLPDGFPMAEYLNRVIGRCLMKQPAERPASIEEIRQSLTWIYRRYYNEAPRTVELKSGMIASNYNSRGLTYCELGRYTEALADFDRAIAMDPIPLFYSNRGIALHHLQRYQEALAAYNSAIASDPGQAIFYTNRAISYMMLEQNEEALADYARAIQLDPGRPKVYVNRATLLGIMDRVEEALLDLDRALRVDPDNANAYLARGIILIEEQRFGEALADLSRAVQLDPHNYQSYHQLAIAYLNLDQQDKAIECYTRAIQFNPGYADAYSHRASLYNRQGREDDALADLNRALELDPADVGSYINRSNILKQRGYMSEALDDLNRAVELSAGFPAPHLALGLLLFELMRFAEALPHFEFVMQNPMDPILLEVAGEHISRIQAILEDEADLPAPMLCLRRALSFIKEHHFDAAVHELDRAIQLDASFGPAYRMRGNIRMLQGQPAAGLADIDHCIQLEPADARGYTTRSKLYSDLGRYEEALADLNTAITLDATDADTFFQRAELLRRLERYGEAFDDYSIVISHDPSGEYTAEAHYRRAGLYGMIENYAAALTDMNHALRLNPNDVSYYLTRGDAYRFLERYDEALADYSTAIQLDPGHPYLYCLRARFYHALQYNEAALADFQRALKLDPEYARAYHWRGRLWFSLDAYSEALDDLLQGLNLAGDAEELELTADIAMDLGYLWFELEDYQGALESFSLADSLGHPKAAEAINSIRQGRR